MWLHIEWRDWAVGGWVPSCPMHRVAGQQEDNFLWELQYSKEFRLQEIFRCLS